MLTRAEETPTTYQFLFGDPSPQSTVASTSSNQITLADATGFVAGAGSIRVDGKGDQEYVISTIVGNVVTVTPTPTHTPASGDAVLFLPDGTHTPNCYLQIIGETIALKTDTTSNGTNTDKIVFSDYCDVQIGAELGGGTSPDVGNVKIITENFNNDFYGYGAIFRESCRVRCNAFLTIIGKGNTRMNFVNRNPLSDVRLILGGHSVHPSAERVGLNVDVSVDTQEIIGYLETIDFRNAFVPGGLKSRLFGLTSAVIPNSADRFTLAWNAIVGTPKEYTVRGLSSLVKIGASDQPRLRIRYVGTDGDGVIVLDRFGVKRGDAYFSGQVNQHNLTIELSQRLNFKFQTPAGVLVSAHCKVESGSYVTAFSSSNSGTPTITDTDYGTVQEFDDSEESVDIVTAILAMNKAGNQDTRDADSATSIVSTDLHPVRYSIWAWGKQIIFESALTIAEEEGKRTSRSR